VVVLLGTFQNLCFLWFSVELSCTLVLSIECFSFLICHHCAVNGKRLISMEIWAWFSVCLSFSVVGSDKFKVGKSEEKKK